MGEVDGLEIVRHAKVDHLRTSLAPTFMTIKAYSGLTMAIGSSVMSRCETCDLGFGPTAAGLSVHDFRPPETQVICPADLSFGFE